MRDRPCGTGKGPVPLSHTAPGPFVLWDPIPTDSLVQDSSQHVLALSSSQTEECRGALPHAASAPPAQELRAAKGCCCTPPASAFHQTAPIAALHHCFTASPFLQERSLCWEPYLTALQAPTPHHSPTLSVTHTCGCAATPKSFQPALPHS